MAKRRKASDAAKEEGWLSPAGMAAALGVAQELIDAHVEQGAPTDNRGRLHVAGYTSWIVERLIDLQRGQCSERGGDG